jgi:AbrB family looped-hinge helix DNA binding protein
MVELTVTAKGQVTLRKAVLEHLGVRPGERVRVALLPDGRVELVPARGSHTMASLYGRLHRPGQRPATLEEMQDAIEAGAAASCE